MTENDRTKKKGEERTVKKSVHHGNDERAKHRKKSKRKLP